MLDFDTGISPTWMRIYDVFRRTTALVFKYASPSTKKLVDQYVRIDTFTNVVRSSEVFIYRDITDPDPERI